MSYFNGERIDEPNADDFKRQKQKRCPSRPDRLLSRRREVVERRIEYLDNKISKDTYAGTVNGHDKAEASALKALLMELDHWREHPWIQMDENGRTSVAPYASELIKEARIFKQLSAHQIAGICGGEEFLQALDRFEKRNSSSQPNEARPSDSQRT